MPRYTFSFKKNDIKLEYVTTDKESMERQFNIWVTCASVWAYNREHQSNDNNFTPSESIDMPKEPVINNKETEEERINRESQRIIEEYKAEMDNEANQDSMKQLKEEFKDNIEQEFLKDVKTKNELSALYGDKTPDINNLNEETIEKPNESDLLENDFDSFLQKSISTPQTEVKEKQDERFLKVLSHKNVEDKLDLLILTAYYLSEFERLDRFTLKLVNAKLMENLNDVVDSTVLQQGIDGGYIENVPNYTNIPSSVEYRLTEAGEAAFLNGRN